VFAIQSLAWESGRAVNYSLNFSRSKQRLEEKENGKDLDILE